MSSHNPTDPKLDAACTISAWQCQTGSEARGLAVLTEESCHLGPLRTRHGLRNFDADCWCRRRRVGGIWVECAEPRRLLPLERDRSTHLRGRRTPSAPHNFPRQVTTVSSASDRMQRHRAVQHRLYAGESLTSAELSYLRHYARVRGFDVRSKPRQIASLATWVVIVGWGVFAAVSSVGMRRLLGVSLAAALVILLFSASIDRYRIRRRLSERELDE